MFQRISRRLQWYKARFQVNNPVVGRAVELAGNRVRMDGLSYSVDTPFVTRAHKSTIAFGLHEIEERALVRQWVPPDLPVVELGGGLGIVSCLINKKLSRRMDHIVVEANPSLVEVLDKNKKLNRAGFEIVNKAVAYGRPTIELGLDEEFVGSSTRKRSAKVALVKTTTVEELAKGFDRFGLVCDIEGMESDVIDREFRKLGDRIRYFLPEMHPAILGQEKVTLLLQQLVALGFVNKEQMGDCFFFSR